MLKMLLIEVTSVDNVAMFIMIRLPLVEELPQEVHILQVPVKHPFVRILSSPERNRNLKFKCTLMMKDTVETLNKRYLVPVLLDLNPSTL